MTSTARKAHLHDNTLYAKFAQKSVKRLTGKLKKRLLQHGRHTFMTINLFAKFAAKEV